MPVPSEFERQDGENSCGYHALANAINLMPGQNPITAKSLMRGPEDGVERLNFQTLNKVLAENNLPYKATLATSGGAVTPFQEVLGEGVYIAKGDYTTTELFKGGSTKTDKHAVVLANFKRDKNHRELDSWTVIDSAHGNQRTIARGENYSYETVGKEGGVDRRNYKMKIDGVVRLEKSSTPGGLQPPKSSWYVDLFCGCFGKKNTS